MAVTGGGEASEETTGTQHDQPTCLACDERRLPAPSRSSLRSSHADASERSSPPCHLNWSIIVFDPVHPPSLPQTNSEFGRVCFVGCIRLGSHRNAGWAHSPTAACSKMRCGRPLLFPSWFLFGLPSCQSKEVWWLPMAMAVKFQLW